MDIAIDTQAYVRKKERCGGEKLKEILLKKIKKTLLDKLSFSYGS